MRLKKSIVSMVSVGGGGTGGSIEKGPGFLFSPSTEGDEMMIIDNFRSIQQGERKRIGIIGTQSLREDHYQMIELLSYALVLSGNHIFTSGSAGSGAEQLKSTNSAVIYGALRACNADLLTVILPQSMFRQPPEVQQLLMRVANLIEHPENDDMEFKEAATICNDNVLSCVDKLLIFAYRDSNTILSTADSVADKIQVTKFFLD
jgi:hypothetical protein